METEISNDTFLQKSAKYIFEKHTLTQLRNVCVVLPTRRAVFYFKNDLAFLSDSPFLAPKVVAIDDFIMEMSGVNQIDSVSLLFELFETFKEFDPSIEFDRFITWASTLLRDFDLIDQYLVSNPKAVFDYMNEATALARWNLELAEAGKPNLEKIQITNTTDKYFRLFENINHVYNKLHSNLIDKGLAFRGMSYRLFANDVQKLLEENKIFEKFYFIGFNALSASEEKIIETLVKANRAETLWDADSYLMDDKIRHKGGKLLRQFKSSLKFGKWNWQTEYLLKSERNIRIYGVENATLQAKLAGKIYAEEILKFPKRQTAIVLCDENLLNPVLFSLDEHIKNFNITMGLSLRNSPLFTLIEAIFELQQNIVEFKSKSGETFKIPKYSHRHISKILNHPLIRPILLKNKNPNTDSALNYIIKNNLVYLSEKEILELGKYEEIFKIIFTRWGDDSQKALKSFYKLIDELRQVYKESKDAIEIEYLYLFLTILNRLEKILFSNKDFKLKSFKHFLYELIKQEKIPFSGEPIANLQIMGMLETRCLDFEHIIFLSVNEGILPVGKKQNSLIPFDACVEYGLPVHSDQDSIMAYHFFRLLQRAKEIDIMYVLPTGDGVGGGGGEKSRFILQIENELAKLNDKNKISYPKINFTKTIDNEVISKIDILKSEEILSVLKKNIEEKGLYPTHLTEYLSCSLKYYFNKIAEISRREEVDEKFGADIFGTWLHNTLEQIDKDFGPLIQKDDIQVIINEIPKRLEQAYLDSFGGFVIESGMNFLLKQVGEQLLKDFFKFQLEKQNFPIEVLEVEKKIEIFLEKEILGKVQKIKIAGRVDRIEREGKVIKVIDYKTGIVKKKDLKEGQNQKLEEAIIDADKDKLRQLWLYQYLILKRMYESQGLILGGEKLENYGVIAKIYSFRNMKENLEVNLSFPDDPSIFGFIEKSEEILTNIVTEILNPEISFSQTHDLVVCERCDFHGICGR